MALNQSPQVVVIAGPNGAGKTTAAPSLLQGALQVDDFINVDQLAIGLSGFDPASAGFRAGRILLEQIVELTSSRASFAFESTLSGLSLIRRMEALRTAGYDVHIAYLWLNDPDLAIERVKRRARMGGHDVPEEDIRRRFRRSVLNFDRFYAPLAASWRLHDAAVRWMPVIAYRLQGGDITVEDNRAWEGYRGFVRSQRDEPSGGVKLLESRSEFASSDAGVGFGDTKAINDAMRKAWERAVRRHRRLGFGILVWENGQIVDLDPWTVEIEEDLDEPPDFDTYEFAGHRST